MSEKPVYVVSDTHLGAVPRETERAFRGFLDHVAQHASALLINGDLFDFWFEYRHVILREHFRVVAALADVVDAGVKVWFVGGNHDAWAGSFLRDEVGVEVLHGPAVLELAGRRTLVGHGGGGGGGVHPQLGRGAAPRRPHARSGARRPRAPPVRRGDRAGPLLRQLGRL